MSLINALSSFEIAWLIVLGLVTVGFSWLGIAKAGAGKRLRVAGYSAAASAAVAAIVLLLPLLFSINYDYPKALLLLLLAFPIACLGLASLATLDTARRWTAIATRLGVLLIITLMLAGLQTVRRNTDLTVGAVVDLSPSTRQFFKPPKGENDEQRDVAQFVDDYLRRAAQKDQRPDDRFFQVTFDQRATLRSLPSIGFNTERAATSEPRDGTNAAAALRQARFAIGDDTAGRLMLAWDGNDTHGDVLEAAREAAANNITVDVLPLPYRVENEVQVEALYAPTEAREGQSAPLRAVLRSTQPVSGRLAIDLDDATIDLNGRDTEGTDYFVSSDEWTLESDIDQDVGAATGKYVFVKTFDVPLIYSGANTFTASFQPDDPAVDRITENNQADAFTLVAGKGRVLFVDNEGGNSGNILPQVLASHGVQIEVVAHQGIPRRMSELQKYDALIFQNVPANLVTPRQQELVAKYVNDLGGGFVMVGGPDSFGAGGWTNSPIDKILPVNCQIPSQTVLPSGALVLVIDRSGSMASPVLGSPRTKLELANEAAILAIRTLYPQDLVGVVAFDNSAKSIVKVQPNANTPAIEKRVRSIHPGGGTNIYSGLQMAYDQLAPMKTDDAAIKHIILLTDGHSQGPPGGWPMILGKLRKANITLSTVGVGDAQSSQLLAQLASMGRGQYHPVQDPNNLPQIFIKEAQTIRKNLIKETTFSPKLVSTGSPIMSDIAGVPPLRGLVLTGEKPDPRVFMPMLGPEGEPVFAHWQVGLGRSAAFTSDATNRWATPWLDWGGYADFWPRVIRNVARPSASREVDLLTSVDSDVMTIRLDAAGIEEDDGGPRRRRGVEGGFGNFMEIRGAVIRPDGQTEQIKLEQTGPGIYEANAAASQSGNYIVSLIMVDQDGERRTVLGGISRPPGNELRRFETNWNLINQVASITGGKVLDPFAADPPGLFDRRGQSFVSRSYRPLWLSLLPLLLILFLLDVASRRIAWDAAAIREGLARWWTVAIGTLSPRKTETQATLSALKNRRTQTATQFAGQGDQPAAAQNAASTAPAPAKRKFEAAEDYEAAEDFTSAVGGAKQQAGGSPVAAAARARQQQTTEEDEGPTTSRLLSAKRRARDQRREDDE